MIAVGIAVATFAMFIIGGAYYAVVPAVASDKAPMRSTSAVVAGAVLGLFL
jgi:hypothetical protein